MKTKSNCLQVLLKFLLIEVFSIILNYIFYKISFSNIENDFICWIKLIRIFIIIFVNYFLCIRFVFKAKFKVKTFLLFFTISFFTLFLRKYLLFFLSRHYIYLKGLSLNLFINTFFLIVDMYMKLKMFKLDEVINKVYNFVKKFFSSLNNKWIIMLDKMKYISIFIPKNIYLFLFSIIIIFSTISFYHENNNIILYEQSSVNSNVGPIISDELIFDFHNISIIDDANIVCLKFATYNRINDGLLSIKLYNQESNLIYFDEINTKRIIDGSNFCFKVPKISKEKVNLYKLKVKPLKTDSNNFITIYKDKSTNRIAMSLYKNNNKTFKAIIIILIILLYLIINVLINTFHTKISECKFLLLMLIYIIPIIFVYPPYSNPDEKLHFYQSYSTSQTIEINQSNKIVLPKNIGCLNYTGINYKVDNFESVLKCNKNGKNKKYNISKAPDIEKNIMPSSISIGYIFQSLAIKLTDIFTNSPLLLYYISKFLASLAAFVIIYFCLKKVSRYKRIILFLVTMPMFVQQMCSFSYDSILNTIVIMFFVCYVNILTKKISINFYNIIPLCLVFIYLMILKIVYFPLLLLLFFIPSNKFGSRKNKWLSILLLFVISGIFVYFIKNIFVSNSIVGSTGLKQIKFVLSNPFYMIDVLKNTYLFDSWNYVRGLFGFFSWFKFGFDDITIIINAIFMIILFMSESNVINIKKTRFIILLVLFLSVSLIFGSMYFCWDYNYKLNYIAGVQGRYFLPLLPFLFLLISPTKNKIQVSNHTIYTYINIMLFMHLLYSFIYFY